MEDIFKWYVTNTGYVLQLATPYYEELTARENLTFAAILKLPERGNLENYQRVNDIMNAVRFVYSNDS